MDSAIIERRLIPFLMLKSRFCLLLSLMILAPWLSVKADSLDAECRESLAILPNFLLENDAGARDQLERRGQSYFDKAFSIASEKIANVRDVSDCRAVLNDYLSAWRQGHLWIEERDQPHGDEEGTAKPDLSEPALRPFLEELSETTLAVTLPSFKPAYKKWLEKLLQDHRDLLMSHPNWIIDVRNNAGGFDSTYYPLLPWILAAERIDIGAEFLVTPVNINAQKTVCERYGDTSSNCAEWTEQMVHRMTAANVGSYVGSPGDASSRQAVARPESVRPKQIALLIDKSCSSSCEQFVLTARQSFSVKVLGRPTAGALDYSNVRAYGLPSDSLELFYATSRSQRLPEMPVDVTGITPDIYLKKTQDKVSQRQELLMIKTWLETGMFKEHF